MHEHVSVCEPLHDGVIKLVIVGVIGVVVVIRVSGEVEVDLMPVEMRAVDCLQRREVGEGHHLADHVDGIVRQNRLQMKVEAVVCLRTC